jgi:ubiquinone/menaquinone biosynthesis C-methylase UbiE
MESPILSDLHAALTPLLRYALVSLDLPRDGVVLDLACGPGLKLPLLAEVLGPGVHLLALDRDAIAVYAASANSRSPMPGHAPAAFGPQPEPGVLCSFVVGDALALPLRDGCCGAVFCIASLGLFADQRRALSEMHRIIRTGGIVVAMTGAQLWAQVTRWPPELAALLASEAIGAQRSRMEPEVGAELARTFMEAGFAQPQVRAFLLDGASEPWPAELALLPWSGLRPLVAPRLDQVTLRRCDTCAEASQLECCTLALVTIARNAEPQDC